MLKQPVVCVDPALNLINLCCMCQLQVLTYNGKKKKKSVSKEACMFLSKYEKGIENMFLFLTLLGFDNYRFTNFKKGD